MDSGDLGITFLDGRGELAGPLAGGRRFLLLVGAIRNRFDPGTLTGSINSVPADFLIDETGHLVRCFYGKDAGDHTPFAEIEAWAAGLKSLVVRHTAAPTYSVRRPLARQNQYIRSPRFSASLIMIFG